MDASGADDLSAYLKSFFDRNTRAYEFGSRILHKLCKPFKRLAVRKKIIDQQYLIAFSEKLF